MGTERLRETFDCALDAGKYNRPLDGFLILGSPVGSDAFVEKHLSEKGRRTNLPPTPPRMSLNRPLQSHLEDKTALPNLNSSARPRRTTIAPDRTSSARLSYAHQNLGRTDPYSAPIPGTCSHCGADSVHRLAHRHCPQPLAYPTRRLRRKHACDVRPAS